LLLCRLIFTQRSTASSQRPYKKPWPVADAIDELRKMVQLGKLDENCVNALAAQLDIAATIVENYPDPR